MSGDERKSARVKILFFAKARELAGRKESELVLPADVNSTELKARVVGEFNLESIRDAFILAVNEEFVEPDVGLNLEESDEIAVIPPLSGEKSGEGFRKEVLAKQVNLKDAKMDNKNDFVGLQSSKLDINDIIQSVISPNCGAVSTFIGTTRDNFEQKKVLKLEYEAYEPMAVKELQAICNKIRAQWNVEKIAIYHRLGEVPVTEVSIVIAISSPHRQESLQAVQFAIDTVKASVPIWKKEIYENDKPEWKMNKECSWAANESQKKLKKIHEAEESDCLFVKTPNVFVSNGEIDIDNVCETVEVKSDHDKSDHEVDFSIDPNNLQVKADDKEINRRIQSFLLYRKERVKMISGQPYSGYTVDDSDDGTNVCARVNAAFIRHKDSKSHVEVHRVYNQWSQQNTKPTVPNKSDNDRNNYPSSLDERLSPTEKILGINKPVPRDIYERIKKIEDRLLYLEGISPEYKEDLWAFDDCDSIKSDDKMDYSLGVKPVRKRMYTSADVDSKLYELEDRYGKRAK